MDFKFKVTTFKLSLSVSYSIFIGRNDKILLQGVWKSGKIGTVRPERPEKLHGKAHVELLSMALKPLSQNRVELINIVLNPFHCCLEPNTLQLQKQKAPIPRHQICSFF